MLGEAEKISRLMDQAREAAQIGDLTTALYWANQAARLVPHDPDPKLLQGDIELARNCFHDAAKHYREALRRKPDLVAGHGNLGVAWLRQGDLQKAQKCFERVLHLCPKDSTALLNLGNIAQTQCQLDIALDWYLQAIVADPACVEAMNNAATLLYAAQDFQQSIQMLEQALRIAPSYAEAHNNLGNALCATGNLSAAIVAYRRASELNSGHAGAWNNLGNALVDGGDLEQGITALRRAIQLNPDYPVTYSNYLMALNYMPQLSLDDLLQAHAAFDRRFGRKAETGIQRRLKNTDGRIRVGYVSPDLRQHPVAYLIEPVLAKTDLSRVELFCYADMAKADAVTERLKTYGHAWRNIQGKSDDTVASMISKDRVDILVDLAGHTSLGRPALFARRLAPVQVSWLGYFCTTGLSTMDYFIGDAISTPKEWQPHFSEKLALLPQTRFCYRPPTEAPPVVELPALQGKPFTFGCFNNLAKLNAEVIALWSKILFANPDSRLILRARFLDDIKTRHAIESRFRSAGAPLERIEMYGQVPHRTLLEAYGKIDLALDPFPFGGGMTSLEALWMGVPVLTLMGGRVAGRQTASFLQALGMEEFIASTPEEYINRAKEIGGQKGLLSDTRNTLRERMRTSSLCNERAFTRDLEAQYQQMLDASPAS